MGIVEILLLAVGLSMDAFAISICKGLSVEKIKPKHYLAVGLWFGGFQMLMPTIGFLLGSAFERFVSAIDHWIAFGLLVLLGINMLREAFSKEEPKVDASFGFKTMLVLSVADSIDALAAGVSFAFIDKGNIVLTIALIGVTTFLFSCAGLKIGNVFGSRYKKRAEIVGGVILILLGIKILLSDLGVLPF